MIEYEAENGLAVISWNMRGKGNFWNTESTNIFSEFVKKSIADNEISGVVITSDNPHFHLGDDLQELMKLPDAKTIMEFCASWHQITRAIETSSKPFVAAINGTAVGTGFELCLACHHRVASNNIQARFGFPQINYGLALRGGGTQRIPRMVGIQCANELLLDPSTMTPREALEQKLIDDIVPEEKLLEKAKDWCFASSLDLSKPWDKKCYKIPGPQLWDAQGTTTLTVANAKAHKQTKGNYPVHKAILSCVYEGLQVPLDTGLRIESRWFANILLGDVARNMVRTTHFNINRADRLPSRPTGTHEKQFKTVGIIGAGTMAAGIAHASVCAGLTVVVVGRTDEEAQQGKNQIAALIGKGASKALDSKLSKTQMLQNIQPTTDFSNLAGVQIVVEAAYEDPEEKRDIIQNTKAKISRDVFFTSNISMLPISSLTPNYSDPKNFIGLHFFSPVTRMKLVEIVAGKETSDETLFTAIDYVNLIKKIPIVVNDSNGFYVNRVFETYVQEGLALLTEGVSPALIENAALLSGMPVGPLAAADEVSLKFIQSIAKQRRLDSEKSYIPLPGEKIISQMVDREHRLGKKSGKGFYEYSADQKQYLWPKLSQLVATKSNSENLRTDAIKKRLLYIQALEATRCLEEDVISSPEDADIGSVFGWSFAPHTGGVLSLIHAIGLKTFVKECDLLAQSFGDRFIPSRYLRDRTEQEKPFYA